MWHWPLTKRLPSGDQTVNTEEANIMLRERHNNGFQNVFTVSVLRM